MDIKHIIYSIVVIGEDHNPTLLNPDFLKINGIVPKDWIENKNPISTPAFSTVSYNNGVNVLLQPQKLQVTDSLTTHEYPQNSNLTSIISEYCEQVPHVKYTAVGINFRVGFIYENPVNLLKTTFFNAASLHDNAALGIGIKLVDTDRSRKRVLNIDTGEMNDGGTSEPAVICFCNNDRRLDTENMPTSEQVPAIMGQASQDYQDFKILLNQLFENLTWTP